MSENGNADEQSLLHVILTGDDESNITLLPSLLPSPPSYHTALLRPGREDAINVVDPVLHALRVRARKRHNDHTCLQKAERKMRVLNEIDSKARMFTASFLPLPFSSFLLSFPFLLPPPPPSHLHRRPSPQNHSRCARCRTYASPACAGAGSRH